MCGIAGFYNPDINFSNNPKDNFKILNNMVKSIKKRGPDGDGTKIINSCCLAHTRLSIIDLETGSQPMSLFFGGNKYHIIYNGEIYNYKQLKKELQSYGFTFNTNSDTEVIGYMFIKYGPLFASMLNGIFSIAIYDEAENSIFLYRDHFGIKPLYYTESNKTLIFASKIDTLFEYPRVNPSIDIKGFNEIFTLGPAKTYGSGVFYGINEILPGQLLSYSPEGINKRFYYQLQCKPHTDSLEDTIEKTKYLLEDSIRSQMISDVPICTFLSGGIDSSIVSAICSKNMKENDVLSTYSFDFEENSLHFKSHSYQLSEDRPYVDIMVKHLNSNHNYLTCRYDTLYDLLEESVDSRCLPTMADIDSSLLYFCGEVSKNHKCALTGECADEIFGGYPWYFNKDLGAKGNFPWMRDISFRKSILNPEFAATLQMEKYVKNAYNKTICEIDYIPEESEYNKNLRKISYLNIRWFMQTLLDRMDRTSMHNGLESRVPFADFRLIDYVYNIPWEFKLLNNKPKGLLRHIAKNYLPETIMNRPKSPYPKSYHPKYEELLKNRIREIIFDSTSPIRAYLNINTIKNLLNEPENNTNPWYGQLMAKPQMYAYIIQVDYWMRKYSLSL
ncbi:MAG: asparagine synthase (glutamine-hydrolyzing) [Lachnospiraceae bacterium]|nr:asparagine synthase (glutamine-hydrolyzing) [Lachnospiraceae bacterium]